MYKDNETVLVHLDNLETLEGKKFFLSHIYIFGGVVNEILDDGKIWNHSGMFHF